MFSLRRAVPAPIAVIGLCVFSGLATGQEIHHSFCAHGCPAGGPATNDVIIREIYVLSSNDATKFADWVAYRVTRDTIGVSHTRNWKTDPLLAANETLEPDDYRGANAALKTDRGHQVPLASFAGTPHWSQTNYLSNITPQSSSLNQGAWVKLENAERALARSASAHAVYVTSGPLYEGNAGMLPKADESHAVPSGYWKVLAVAQGDVLRVAAFIFQQETTRDANICDHLVTVNEVEARSGLNLFHALPAAREEPLEATRGTLATSLGCVVE
ncbi:MAG: DNA/RNA non-specific endonuclease [Myxococcales bacterium]|nr:DNA/RNA non-specific endonuclease [Myxococcales bacterium]MDD9965859.1 DNA/RNA non-specific endonuclease [Myxococcales bacterium]